MSAIEEQSHRTQAARPALWHEPAPRHFDLAFPWWVKTAAIVAATVIAILWLDFPIAKWALVAHPIPDLFDRNAKGGDAGRELMMLEQWGQWTSSILVIAAVALIDRAGRRRALAIAVGCLVTVLLTYLLKDLFGRTRPNAAIPGVELGSWIWGGPAAGFANGSKWGSFPSAHTTGAFALSVGLSWFYPRARGLFMALAVITAVQRVLHSAHFLSDVIAGMGIAVFVTRWTLRAKLAGRLIDLSPPALRDWFLRDSST